MRHLGTITRWDDVKGFGFIKPHAGGNDVFLHIQGFAPGQARPRGNERVSYLPERDEKDRFRAEDVRYQRHLPYLSFQSWLVAAFFCCLVFLTLAGAVPLYSGTAYVLMSLVTFSVYGRDKAKAERGAWRTPETTLHVLELLCGWPGALAAQRCFRHKNRKISFQIQFWCMVLLNLAALGWLLWGHARLSFWQF